MNMILLSGVYLWKVKYIKKIFISVPATMTSKWTCGVLLISKNVYVEQAEICLESFSVWNTGLF